MKFARLFALIFFSIVSASGIAATPPVEQQLSIEAVQVVSISKQATIFFRAKLGSRPITTLSENQVKVFAGNTEMPQKSFDVQAKSPLFHAILLDRSGSVKGLPLLEAQKAAELLVKAMPNQDQVAVYAFSDTLQLLEPFTPKRDQILTAIRSLKSDGRRTELNFAVYSLVDQLEIQRPGPVSIIILSDGKDEGTSYTLDNITDKARAASIILSGVGSSQINRKYLLSLEKLSRFTGGYYTDAANGIRSEADAARLIKHFSNRSAVTISLDNIPAGTASQNATLSLVHGETVTVPLTIRLFTQGVSAPQQWYLRGQFLGVIVLALAGLLIFAIYIKRRRDDSTFDGYPCSVCGTGRSDSEAPCVKCALEQPPTEHHQWGVLQGNCPELAGWQCALGKTRYSIGSADSNDIIIPIATVSRTHASIHLKDGHVYLVDLKSKNGTRSNNELVTDVELTDGCSIQLGSARLTFFFKGR